jgi:hypothetical protein
MALTLCEVVTAPIKRGKLDGRYTASSLCYARRITLILWIDVR